MRQIPVSVKQAGAIAYYCTKIRERKKEKDNENLVGEKECFPKHTLGSHLRQTEQFHKGVSRRESLVAPQAVYRSSLKFRFLVLSDPAFKLRHHRHLSASLNVFCVV